MTYLVDMTDDGMPNSFIEVQSGRAVLITSGIRGGVTSEYVDGIISEQSTGKHVDDMRALDTPFIINPNHQLGSRIQAIGVERLIAFDNMAAEMAATKSRQDTALMIDIFNRI